VHNPSIVGEGVVSYADRKREEADEKAGVRFESEQFPCTDCGADIGQTCHHADGVPLGASPAHPARITAARLSWPASDPCGTNGGG
jgi:hypothetical protein